MLNGTTWGRSDFMRSAGMLQTPASRSISSQRSPPYFAGSGCCQDLEGKGQPGFAHPLGVQNLVHDALHVFIGQGLEMLCLVVT